MRNNINSKYLLVKYMEKTYFISIIVSIVFLLFKIVDTKFIKKKELVVKYIIRDSLLVFLSVICSFYISEQIGELNVNSFVGEKTNVSAFTNEPEF